jgi:type I restriction enzyme S subunit
MALDDLDEARVSTEYLVYALRNGSLSKAISGTAQPQITRQSLTAISIPLPPLSEQRRIADILDRADALRAKRRAALAQLDSLTQSIFLDLFGDPATNPKGWPQVELGNLLENIDSGWSPKCLDRPVENGEWGILKLGAVTWCEYDPAENKALPSDVDPDPSLEVRVNDLLFARKNTCELVAACTLVQKTPPRLMMSDLIFRLRLRSDAEIEPPFSINFSSFRLSAGKFRKWPVARLDLCRTFRKGDCNMRLWSNRPFRCSTNSPIALQPWKS